MAIIGCDDKTAVVEPPPNQPPVIDLVIVPDQVEANTQVNLQVIARDADKDYLAIVWKASEGTVNNDVWTSPARATEVIVSVHVSDGFNPPVTQSQNITVNKELPPEPEPPPPIQLQPIPLPPQPKPEPPPEPEVGEAWNIKGKVGIEYVAPGQETLTVSIGDTVEQVNALAESAEWLGHDNQILVHPRLGEFQCFYDDGKTIGITIADVRYKTAEGIGIGSQTHDVVAKYGEPDNIIQGVQLTFYNYFRSGYVFGFGDTKRVVIITVRG